MTAPDHGLAMMAHAAQRAISYRGAERPVHPVATATDLRQRFCVPLPERPRDGTAVIDDLIAAAEGGLVGNTEGNFFAWVMGGSAPVGVAADWLTSAWGQNAAIYQTAPAAAIAEEAVSDWMLELLDLPRTASVGFVTGATMAAFVGLAAARLSVLERAGHDFASLGLQGAPIIKVFLSEEAHISNITALRFLGLGEVNIVRIAADDQGAMEVSDLAQALGRHAGPKIVIAQAGQINTGAFEDFEAIAKLVAGHNAWLHVDGAFGLWARASEARKALTTGVELADSWSVDGHKWLQIPYDSGFAIVRDAAAHQRAMEISAGYLNASPEDGRNPTQFNPELSRRARGFAAWAVLQALGRRGVAQLVEGHCDLAARLARRLGAVRGVRVLNDVCLNQVLVGADAPLGEQHLRALADRLNARGAAFVRTADWRGQDVLRISVIAGPTREADVKRLADAVTEACEALG